MQRRLVSKRMVMVPDSMVPFLPPFLCLFFFLGPLVLSCIFFSFTRKDSKDANFLISYPFQGLSASKSLPSGLYGLCFPVSLVFPRLLQSTQMHTHIHMRTKSETSLSRVFLFIKPDSPTCSQMSRPKQTKQAGLAFCEWKPNNAAWMRAEYYSTLTCNSG